MLLAISCGLTVANIYYNQPLIGILRRSFGAGGAIDFVPTATQLGYAVGVLALVPLGDRLDRRPLILGQTLAMTLALLLAALAPSPAVLLLASGLLGITATVPQQIIPLAADLADPRQRGAVVGVVMSGLLCGILLARTLAGAVGAAYGWRAVFWVGIGLSLATLVGLAATLPSRRPTSALSYGRLLASAFALMGEEPQLRLATATQGCLFAAFSTFWTILALRLEQPPFGYGADIAGLFGLVGAAGALAAPLAGRFADRHGPRRGVLVSLVAVLACWVVLGAVASIAALVLGIVLLDAGVQGAMIGNQHIIFALRPEARNRINSVYVGAIFLSGAAGSAAAMIAWRAGGWTPVCLLGAALTLAALVLQLATWPRARAPAP